MSALIILAVAAASSLLPSAPAPKAHMPDRRAVLLQAASAAALCAAGVSAPAVAVTVDPDKYGDKELKIATVNKIRQNIRNECGKDLSLLVPLMQLSLADAFSYDRSTGAGAGAGPAPRRNREHVGVLRRRGRPTSPARARQSRAPRQNHPSRSHLL